MTFERWLAFTAVLAVAIVVPGPDFAVILRSALAGVRSGALAAEGMLTGLAVHTTAAAVGLSAVVAAHPALLSALRLAGAAYLLWLGLTTLAGVVRSAGAAHPAGPFAGEDGAPAAAHPYRSGLAVNLLNPKALLFFLGLLPQFVDARTGSVAAQTLVLAGTTIVAAAGWFTLVVLAAARGRTVLGRPGVRRRLDTVAGVAFVGLAARLGIG